MEHVEEAGVHSGDSACAIPPPTLSADDDRASIEELHPRASPTRSTCVGLLNVQYAVKDGQVFVIEANPRASRTVPFVSQGHRRAAGQGRGAGDGRRHARRAARRGPAAPAGRAAATSR